MKINIEDFNLLDYSDWTIGSGATSTWTVQDFSGAVSYRYPNSDPWNNTSNNIYERYGTTTTSRQSLFSPYIPLNTGSSYRVCFWCRQPDSGSTVSRLYWQMNGTSNLKRVSTNVESTTHYFIGTTDCRTYVGTDWRLFVAYLRPVDWSGTTMYGAVYNLTGGTVTTAVDDWKFMTGTTQGRLYTNIPYDSTARFEFAYPRIDLVDGTEPSITALLSNEGGWRDVSEMKINIEDNNILDYSTWQAGQTGSVGQFTEYTTGGGINKRIIDTDPFGNNSVVWLTSSGISGGTMEGGWNMTLNATNKIIIDKTKNYRYSVWLKRKTAGSGGILLGPLVYNSSDGNINFIRVDTGAEITSGWQHNFSPPVGNWCLLTTYIFNSGYTTGSTQQSMWYSGGTAYAVTSPGVGDYKFMTANYSTHMRLRSPFSGAFNSSYEMCYPRFDLIDGTEPSIATLLSNEGMWRSGTTMIYVDDVWKNT